MRPANIVPGVFAVGAIDWNRRLFDSLIPLPDGTSYNSYLIQASEKTVLIDTVDPVMKDDLFSHLSQLGVNKIDYVIANHAEQDHSGSIPFVLEKFPSAKVVCSTKCKPFLMDLLRVPEDRIMDVADGAMLSLGNRTLKFIHTPWVHWPETMVTYLVEDKILFSCDFFGGHVAGSDLFVTDESQIYEASKRYFAEIMMPFRTNIEKDLDKIKDLTIDFIAPSHGPVHNHPTLIMQLWRSWVTDEPKNIAIIAYTSMHGSTALMVNRLAESLGRKGVEVKVFDLTVTDIGKLAMSLVDAATVVLATPTVLAGPHPAVVYAAFLANALRPRIKYATIIGSYLWGGKTVETLKGLLSNLTTLELIEPILVKGLPSEADLVNLDKMAETIAEKHKPLALAASVKVTCDSKI
jgi:flavorubredoxin